MRDIVIMRQPGRPCTSSEREYARQPKREEGKWAAGSRIALYCTCEGGGAASKAAYLEECKSPYRQLPETDD